jgi:hypothetical protein
MAIDMRELGVVRIASPCKADWAAMTGDEQVRHCALCKKNVYNLSSMTAEDARTLLLEKEGKLCVRFYQRKDGTMLTADCPTGVRRKQVRWVAAMASAASFVLAGAAFVLDSGGFGQAAQRLRMMVTGESCSSPRTYQGEAVMGAVVVDPSELKRMPAPPSETY